MISRYVIVDLVAAPKYLHLKVVVEVTGMGNQWIRNGRIGNDDDTVGIL